ncbi:MAG: GNAT family N-acetyltransferase [bacterium]
MNISIRYARVEDATDIRRIQSEGWYDSNISPETGVTIEFLRRFRGYTIPPSEERVRMTEDTIKKDPLSTVVAELHGSVIGWIAQYKKDTIHTFGIYISRSHRGEGVGSRLMNKILEDAPGSRLTCHVTKSNTKGIRFYERFGFHIVGEENEYFDDAKTIYLPTFIMHNYE